MSWTWQNAIAKNRGDLTKIIAGLYVLAGWVPGEERPTFIRRAARNELKRLLRVTEAALRRLIFIMATVRRYDGKPAKVSNRPLPDFASFGKGSSSRKRKPTFNLIDPRKPIRFVDEETWSGKQVAQSGPRVWTLDSMNTNTTPTLLSHSPRGQAQDEGLGRDCPAYAAAQVEAISRDASASADADLDREAEYKQTSQDEGVIGAPANPVNLLRRLEALDNALKTLPRQARRMARLIERRKTAPSGPNCVPPIKIGPPPGHRKPPVHEADHVLRECHGLAADLRFGDP